MCGLLPDVRHFNAGRAIADYKTLVELLPSTSPEVVGIRRSLAALTPRVEAAQKRETAEMLDKLKGLGNSLLGATALTVPDTKPSD